MKKRRFKQDIYGESWVDGKGNRWTAANFTEVEAAAASKTLDKCTGCIDCLTCSNCHDCVRCTQCSMCHYCHDCDHCIGCYGCEECNACLESVFCHDCTLCEHCHDCIKCSKCGFCQGCEGFKENPKRYVELCSKPYVGCMTAYWVTGDDMYIYAYGRKTWSDFKAYVEKESSDPDILADMKRFYLNVCDLVRKPMRLEE